MSELYPELGDFFHEPGSDSSVCGARHMEHTLPVPSGTSSGGVEKESLRRLVAIYQSVIL